MKIIALVENTCQSGAFSVEHGLSLYIETNNHKILFDAGQTALFAENAKKLGVNLQAVDALVLSHGHYDHGGGLDTFLKLNTHAPVYLSKLAFCACYNGSEKYIGLDSALKNNARLVFVDDTHVIDKGITLSTQNDKRRKFNMQSTGLTVCKNGSFLPDDFCHEQYLLIEEDGKRILFSGCSHKGILDIADWFCPDVLVGGFHFSKLPLDETLAEYARMLDAHKTVFYTCHCTGTEQFAYMKKHMRHLHYLSTGDSIVI